MYDRILVPTDGSTEGERPVAHAAELARAHGADLVAVFVVDTASYGGLPMETSIEGITQVLEEEAETAIERVETIAGERGVSVDGRVVRGTPSKEIVRVAEAATCDLIVMGTHGRGGINRLLLGSVAERVVRSAPIPVLTVRVGEDALPVPTAETLEANDDSPAAESEGNGDGATEGSQA
jgi:nucleotide-binding universal stress UspA family protein